MGTVFKERVKSKKLLALKKKFFKEWEEITLRKANGIKLDHGSRETLQKC